MVNEPISKLGVFSSAGAVIGALLASACCWLPLLLVALGSSAFGVSKFFEAYRIHLLVSTGLLLAASFYLVYFRKPKCAPGEACEVPNPALQRINRVSLWVATAFVVIFAAFPNYIGSVLGEDGTGSAATAVTEKPNNVSRSFSVEGMTCEACASHIRTVVGKVDGVTALEVSYENKSATVVFEPGTVNDQAVIDAISTLGYVTEPSTNVVN